VIAFSFAFLGSGDDAVTVAGAVPPDFSPQKELTDFSFSLSLFSP